MYTIRESNNGFDFVTKEGAYLVSVEKMECFVPEMEKQADEIIAILKAAPSLLEACKIAFEFANKARKRFPKSIKHPETFHLNLVCASLGKAIAKAKGE